MHNYYLHEEVAHAYSIKEPCRPRKKLERREVMAQRGGRSRAATAFSNIGERGEKNNM